MPWSPSGRETAALRGVPLEATGAVEARLAARVAGDAADLARNDAVLLALPAYGHRAVIDALAPHLQGGRPVIFSSHASFGALHLARRLSARGVFMPIVASRPSASCAAWRGRAMRDGATPMREILAMEGVTKRFGGRVAVDGLDLGAGEGQFVTLPGPSGCGRSTTLRILGGFERPDGGRVVLDGRDVTRLPPEWRNVNMVFQDYALFPHMSVRRNIAFGLELRGSGRRAIAARVDDLAAFLELSALLDRRPDQLSGGQRQHVALARALAPDFAVLLLDEPLGALDAKLRGQVEAELKGIRRRTSKTFVFVTHDRDEALTMSDRVVVVNGGRVEQDGTPEEFYLHPASRFAAEFIGETNLVTGRVAGRPEGGRVALDWNGLRVWGRAPRGGAPARGEPASASLRLERVRVGLDRPAVSNALAARVVSRSFKGSRTELALALDGCADARLRVHADTDHAARLGDGPGWPSWDEDDLAGLERRPAIRVSRSAPPGVWRGRSAGLGRTGGRGGGPFPGAGIGGPADGRGRPGRPPALAPAPTYQAPDTRADIAPRGAAHGSPRSAEAPARHRAAGCSAR